MGSEQEQSPLIVIVGQTASGKSELAMMLAKKFNGEIISADSRTLYKGMDIGTAKPTQEQQRLVRHHLIDISTPDKPITASMYKNRALEAIDDVSKRGKLPILVGGSGLYVDAVVFDFQFNHPSNMELRAELDKLPTEELQARIKEQGLDMPSNDKNRRHLTRRLEMDSNVEKNDRLRENTLMIGIRLTPEELKSNISSRVKVMMAEGLKEEAAGLTKRYGWETEPLRTIGYQEFRVHFLGQQDLEATESLIISETTRYAKRQNTWFKRNKNIQWIEEQIQAVDLVTTFLNK